MRGLPALRLDTAGSNGVTTATTLSSHTILSSAVSPATPSLRAEPSSFCGAFAEPSRQQLASRRNNPSLNHGRRSGEDPANRVTTSALSSPSGAHPITPPQSPLHRSPSKKAPSAAEVTSSPSVATGAAAGVASAYLSTSSATTAITTTTTSPMPSPFPGSFQASLEASYSASLRLTVPHLAAPLDLSPHAHRQTRFAVALAAQLSLFSVLALLQPVSALALAQSAQTSSRRSSASANSTLALLPTCPATWHEKDAAAAAVSDSDRFEAARRMSKSATTKRHEKRRDSRRLTTAKVAGAAVAGEAVAHGAVADTFAAALAGDDWVPQNGNGAARGSSNGNGRGLCGGVRGGDAAAGRGEWQAVSLAEAREMVEPPFKVAAPGQRIVAIGDVHGDWDQTLAALRVAGVLNEKDGVSDDEMWTGGSTVLVQVGDVLDRGDDEIAILSLLRHLDRLAQREGGGVLMLNGNHETMNVAEEFRYVSDGGFEESEDFYSFCLSECGGDWDSAFRVWWQASQELKASKRRRRGPWNGWNPIQGQRQVRERHELFEVGGPMAAELARNNAALMVNDTLFAHGGILPHHVEYGLPRMNRELSQWMRGEEVWGEGGRTPMPFIVTRGYNSVVWTRLYSQEYLGTGEDKYKICTVLAASLDAVGAKRLVVGHTPQVGGANGECGGRVWRIDVGMSSGMLNAPPQVLEIVGDSVQVLAVRLYMHVLGALDAHDGADGAGAAGAALEGVKVLISVFFLGAYSFTAPSTTPQEHTMHMTGQMAREQRAQHWKERRVFFVTGQVLLQDMVHWGEWWCGVVTGAKDMVHWAACPREAIVCLVVDEAHRATGNYAYARVVKENPTTPRPGSRTICPQHWKLTGIATTATSFCCFPPTSAASQEQAGKSVMQHAPPCSTLPAVPSPSCVSPAQLPKVQEVGNKLGISLPKVQEVVDKLGISLVDRCPAMLCRQLYQFPLALPSTSSMPPAQLPKVQEVVDKLGISPITQLPKVKEVVDKLGISLIEYRGDDDPQVAQYMHKRTEQVIKVRMHTAVAEVEKLLVVRMHTAVAEVEKLLLAEQRRCLEALNRLGLVSSALVSSSKVSF
ncbi:unnamed protein product [Closterium sp. Naga37s-1]|nr:unnamed protein product [Closterium sp. Naga37s-1]